MTQRPLWDANNTHPYYCAKAYDQDHQIFFSWEDFAKTTKGLTPNELMLEGKGNFLYDFDDDLNFLYRWDWNWNHRDDPEEAEECDLCDGLNLEECHELVLFYMLQRKGKAISASVIVSKEDEPAIREWLNVKANYLKKVWRPILND